MAKDYISEEKENIIKEILRSKKVRPGQLINYAEFLELYGPYKEKMNELDFADVLGITYCSWQSIRNKGKRAKVLRKKVKEIKKEEIVKELLEDKKIKKEQFINYSQFLELYKPYKEKMSEIEFADILGISYSNFINIKYTEKRAKILKKEIKEIEKEEIFKELLKDKKIKENQSISYAEFLELYETYKERISESDFAEALGITYGNWKAIKNKGQRARILKKEVKKITDKEKEVMISELLENKKIKAGQSINYAEFLELYEPYKEKMNEAEFANVLEITYCSWQSIKNKGQRARILKKEVKEIADKEKEIIANELLESKKIKAGQFVNYAEFLELYEPYKEKISESDFAEALGITYGNWKTIKNKGQRARILKKEVKEITDKEKEVIISELLESKKIKAGQSINYEKFLELYKPYKKKMTEVEFAGILGMKIYNLSKLRNQGIKAKIYGFKLKEKIDRIKYIINKESRYYSKEELNDISEKYGLELDKLILYMCCKESDECLEDYKRVLEEKGQLYIGCVKCTREFATKYANDMLEYAGIASENNSKKYGSKNMKKDIASDSLVYMLKQRGDLEKNFGENEDVAKKYIRIVIFGYIKHRFIGEINKAKEYSFQRTFTTHKGETKDVNVFDIGIEDKSERVEDEIIKKALGEIKEINLEFKEEQYIKMIMNQIKRGVTREEAIANVGETLGLDPKEMLEALQNYLLKTKKVRKTGDGRYIIGDEDGEER